jgi:hypothetical protein
MLDKLLQYLVYGIAVVACIPFEILTLGRGPISHRIRMRRLYRAKQTTQRKNRSGLHWRQHIGGQPVATRPKSSEMHQTPR